MVGSGVTGVEFTRLLDSLGSKVTLLVSRQQVLPIEEEVLGARGRLPEPGFGLLKEARRVQ